MLKEPLKAIGKIFGLNMKPKFVKFFMDIAKETGNLSHARRLKVGAVVVKDSNVIAFGYNGMPAGMNNDCEHKVYANEWSVNNSEWEYQEEDSGLPYNLKTNSEVIHAEANAIAKLARSTNSAEDSTMFITHAPCVECSKLIISSGIKKVYWSEQYRNTEGLELLAKCGIETVQEK